MASAATAKGQRSRKRKKASSSSRLLPWVLTLGAVSMAIAAYDHSSEVKRWVTGGLAGLPSSQTSGRHESTAPAEVAVHPIARPVPPLARTLSDDLIGKTFSGTFYFCGRSGLDNCVSEGNIFWHKKQAIRLADVVVPESDGAKCAAEREKGFAAKVRLRQLLNQGPFELVDWPNRDLDGQGRRLRVVMRNGRSVGADLIRDGLARPASEAGKPWC